jgi:hypothetical protein
MEVFARPAYCRRLSVLRGEWRRLLNPRLGVGHGPWQRIACFNRYAPHRDVSSRGAR